MWALTCREEAYYLCGILSSAPVRCCVTCYMNPTSISAHVLDKLHIPAFDPADSRHLSIAASLRGGPPNLRPPLSGRRPAAA